MPNNNPTTTNAPPHKIVKDDVIWVSYRAGPLWPALVRYVYPKKVSYSFFPVALNENPHARNTFGCHPKLAYALVTTEPLTKKADVTLLKAFRTACDYLRERGRTRGSEIESLGEAMKREGKEEEDEPEARENGRKRKELKRNKVESEDDEEDEDVVLPPSPKKCASSSSDRSTPTDFQASTTQPPITEEQSKGMMKLINERFESLIKEIWKSDEVLEIIKQKTTMKDKLTVKLRNNQFLSESDYEALFERIVEHIRRLKNYPISLICAFNLTASHVIPHVLITCYATWKNLEIREAREIFYQHSTRVLGLDSSMDIPMTDHLEELCRLACDESDAIKNE